jgi:hypothetical protein
MDTLTVAADLVGRLLAAHPELDVDQLAEVDNSGSPRALGWDVERLPTLADRPLVSWEFRGSADYLRVDDYPSLGDTLQTWALGEAVAS